jgi:hypothetical protein
MSPSLTRGRNGRVVAIAVAIVLCTVTAVAAPAASLNIFWRYTVLSFDNPATQLFDEVLAESKAISTPDAPTQHSGRLPVTGRIARVVTTVVAASPALSSGITRSPPTA